MAFFKTAAAAVVGMLALSGEANARSTLAVGSPSTSTKTTKSSAKCTVVSTGYTEVSSKQAIATSVADASAFICGGGSGTKTAETIALATADAFALAVAHASATCELTGDASAYVNAQAHAQVAAEVFVKAYASAWASAGDCKKCGAFAKSFGYVEKYVFLEAVASTKFDFSVYTTAGTRLAVQVLAYKSQIKSVVAKSLAVAFADAAAFKESDGCLAFVNTQGCIWTPDSPDPEACFDCLANAVSEGSITEIDAFASAVAKTASYTCDPDLFDYQEAEDSAEAFAKALAIAVSQVFVSCYVEGEGYACAEAGTYIEETAHATATAYAQAWAEALVCETCIVSVDVFVEAVSELCATAATNAYAKLCVTGGYWEVGLLEIQIAEAVGKAVAEASVAAISYDISECIAAGYVDVSTGTRPPH